jgi:hypothetical protein
MVSFQIRISGFWYYALRGGQGAARKDFSRKFWEPPPEQTKIK